MCKLILVHFFQQEFDLPAAFCKLDKTGWVFACSQLLLDCIVTFFNKIVNECLFAMVEFGSEMLKFNPKIAEILIALPKDTILSTF